MKYKSLYLYAVLAAAIFCWGCGSSSPTTPVQLPSSIEFADAGIVVQMEKSIAFTANQDFTGGTVRFSNLATGLEVTNGACGTAAISGTDITITGPSTWPNQQSQCGLCFEYGGTCLTVTLGSSSSSDLADTLIAEADASLTTNSVLTVDIGTGVSISFPSFTNMTFPSTAQSYMYIQDSMYYEKGEGTASYVGEYHLCGTEYVSSGGTYVQDRIVHFWTTDLSNISSSQFEYITATGSTGQNCRIAVADDASGNKITAVSVKYPYCALPNTVCYYMYINGTRTTFLSQEGSSTQPYLLNNKIDSAGTVHVFYYNQDEDKIYHSSCTTSGACTTPSSITSSVANIYVQNESYGDNMYLAYESDDDGDGYTDIFVSKYNLLTGASTSPQKWSAATAARGDATYTKLDVQLVERTQQVMVTVGYAYETELNAYARYSYVDSSGNLSPSAETQLNDLASSVLVNPSFVQITADGNIQVSYIINYGTASASSRHQVNEISGGAIRAATSSSVGSLLDELLACQTSQMITTGVGRFALFCSENSSCIGSNTQCSSVNGVSSTYLQTQ